MVHGSPALVILLLGLIGGNWAARKRENLSASGRIVNDQVWKDNRNTYIKAGYGGHITKIGRLFYWVGNDPDTHNKGSDIHIYSSKTLGSTEWTHVSKVIDAPPGSDQPGLNLRLLRSPATGRYVIIAKNGFMFYESVNVEGPYTLVRHLSTYQIGPNREQDKVGGMSAFQDGNDAYVITSRRDLTSRSQPPQRHIGIYKLTSDFLDVDKEILWLPVFDREAMFVFKRFSTYYMTASHTSGWSPSRCYYRTAKNLAGPWSEEEEIKMVPSSKANDKSHGSQCRWIMDVGESKHSWVFAGDRYPFRPNADTSEYPLQKGHYIFLPVTFENGRPVVTFQKDWQVSVQ